MDQKLILITGATDGIGKQTALELARGGARLLLHGRSQSRLEATRDEVRDLVNGSVVEIVTADFSSLAEVRSMAEEVRARHGVIDVLINNAGLFMNQREISRDGYELTFAVNHLAPFLLTHLLLDALRAAPRARIVNVSSMGHLRGELDFDNLQAEKSFTPYGAYALSKLGNVLFTIELARRLREPITVNSLHPGVVSTKLLVDGVGMQGQDSLSQSAATSVFLATSSEVDEVSGRFFVRCREAEMHPAAARPEIASRFYELSAELTGIRGLPAA